jgi:RNA polymerase sigma factor (sigma-70 family)
MDHNGIIKKYEPKLRKYLKKQLIPKYHLHIDDILQETWISFLSISTTTDNILPLLYTITSRRMKDEIRRITGRAKNKIYLTVLKEDIGLPVPPILYIEILDIINTLPIAYRDYVVKICVERMKYKDVAELYDCSVFKVMKKVRRGREILQRKLLKLL